ncbi:MAG TPA: GFA family protein [Thermohalobaculum sp.]|nr:GFA family protein [Thermohalobaculum sp.]
MSDNDTAMEGGCACGKVRFRMSGAPMFVHCCHCRECQRLSGGAFALNAMVEADRVDLLSGTPQGVTVPTASGRGQKIARCPACQVAVWSNYAGAGDGVHFVRVGTLDDPDALPPDIHIYTASKQPWVIIPEGARAVPEYYRAAEFWPAESLVRFKAARR